MSAQHGHNVWLTQTFDLFGVKIRTLLSYAMRIAERLHRFWSFFILFLLLS